jgi:hypothetical protein
MRARLNKRSLSVLFSFLFLPFLLSPSFFFLTCGAPAGSSGRLMERKTTTTLSELLATFFFKKKGRVPAQKHSNRPLDKQRTGTARRCCLVWFSRQAGDKGNKPNKKTKKHKRNAENTFFFFSFLEAKRNKRNTHTKMFLVEIVIEGYGRRSFFSPLTSPPSPPPARR